MSWLKLGKKLGKSARKRLPPLAKKAWKKFTSNIKAHLSRFRNNDSTHRSLRRSPLPCPICVDVCPFVGRQGQYQVQQFTNDVAVETSERMEMAMHGHENNNDDDDHDADGNCDDGDYEACDMSTTFTYLHGVDAEAEEFICQFKHYLKIQREESLEDFDQMLARGL